MKWFKHMSAANADDKIVAIRAKFGMWGVGCYWTLVEMVARQMKPHDPKPEAVLRMSELAGFFGCKRNKLVSFLKHLRNECEIKAELDGDLLRIAIPKLLQIKDNYSDDLEDASKIIPSKEVDVEVDTEREKKADRATPVVPLSVFDEVWNSYPNKSGRKAASRHWAASVKTPEDVAAIKKALTNYTASERVRKGFIKNGSTWFNEWRDWLEPSPSMIGGPSNGSAPIATVARRIDRLDQP